MSEELSIEFEPHFDNIHEHPHSNSNSNNSSHRSDVVIVNKSNKITIYGTDVRKELSKHFVLATETYEIEKILAYDNKMKRKKGSVIVDSDDDELQKKSRHEKLLIEREKENLRIANQNNTYMNVSLDAIKKAHDAPIELLAIAPVVISEDDLLVINDYKGMYS